MVGETVDTPRMALGRLDGNASVRGVGSGDRGNVRRTFQALETRRKVSGAVFIGSYSSFFFWLLGARL